MQFKISIFATVLTILLAGGTRTLANGSADIKVGDEVYTPKASFCERQIEKSYYVRADNQMSRWVTGLYEAQAIPKSYTVLLKQFEEAMESHIRWLNVVYDPTKEVYLKSDEGPITRTN